MDEYIKREDALDALMFEPEGSGYQSRARDVIRLLPTADVAPRAEVAREIFWEIDKLLLRIITDDEEGTQFIGVDMQKYYALKKKYTATTAEPPKGKQPKDSENYEKKRLLPGDCFHGEIWYMCPYCFTGIEAHSIPKDRICHKCGNEYL